MVKGKPSIALCSNHDCPAADVCATYIALNVAQPGTIYFKPEFDPRRVPPCHYYREDKPIQ